MLDNFGNVQNCSRNVAFGSDVVKDEGHPHLSHNGEFCSLESDEFDIYS